MTTIFAENLNQAWQTVLGQLQTEMPRASFDTWVRDTHPISYVDGLFTVGVRNAYARDWLESRLASTASRLLIGLMNESVEVVFEVSTLPDVETDEAEDDEEASGKNEITQATATRYEEEVKPHRVIVIPGYALRLLSQGDLSAKSLSLWIAFRQAVYFDWKKTTGAATVAKNIPHQAITRFANMGRASYFRAINAQDELAGGLVKRLPEEAQLGFNPHLDNAIRWQVSMSPNLTRHDAAVIEMILSADIALAGEDVGKQMAAALDSLQDMTKRHPSEYLDEINVLSQKQSATNVVAILRRALKLDKDIPAGLLEAAEALQNRLMRAFGSVVIPHHFLTTSAPFFGLTQSQMWTVIVLRDRVFYDYESGAEYDFVMAKQGLASISTWTGVSVKSLKRWFEQPEFQRFVHLSNVQIPEEEQGEGAERLRSFIGCGGAVITVEKNEPPLGYIAENETRIPVWTKRALGLDKVSTGSGQSEHRVWTKRAPGLDKVSTGSGQSEHRVWTKRALGLDKVSTGSGQSEHPLNNLYKPLLNPFKPHNPQQTTSQALPSRKSSPVALPVVGVGWEMSALLALNPVSDQKLKTRLLEQGDPTAFVSWLLYAYSPEGQGITSPSSFAIHSLGRDPRQGSKQTYVEIARQGPERLREFIDNLADPLSAGFHDDSGFARIFRKIPAYKLHDLEGCLFTHSLETVS